MPATLIARPPEEDTTVSVPFVADLRDNLRAAHERIRENTKRFAKTEKKYYDKKAQPDNLKVGQKVWFFWPKPLEQMRFKKLYKFWNGPWIITKFKSPLVVEIEHVSKKTKHGRLSKQTVHVDRLTPCKLADDVEVESDVEPDTQPTTDTQADTQAATQVDIQGDSQLDSQDLFAEANRPSRTRRLPKSLDGYIL